MSTDAYARKPKKNHQTNVFEDGAVTKIGLGKKYVDGYVLLTDDIYGGAIPEGSKIKLFQI